MKRSCGLCFLSLCIWTFGISMLAQNAPRYLTNADIVTMTKAGISASTIVLSIKQGASKFDTSPDALAQLKKEGVADDVLNAMLIAGVPSPAATPPATATAEQDCSAILDKVLTAMGGTTKLASVNAIHWKGTATQSGQSFQIESTIRYPDTVSMAFQNSTIANRVVVSPQFTYETSGKITKPVPQATADDYLAGLRKDPYYIASHRSDFKCIYEGSEQIAAVKTDKLKVTGAGRDFHWNVDQTGRIVRVKSTNIASGEQFLDFSDWRMVDGIAVAFRRHVGDKNGERDLVISEYEVNPVIDANLFRPPADNPVSGFTFKVLQSESVPYVVQTNGGISTNCNISGSSNTTFSAYSTGNTTFGNATTTPDLHMNCNSYSNSIRWQHMLNAMLVEASDGNAYIIACDRAWRWSKCTGLKPGDTFNARRSDKGFVVQFFNTKQQEKEATYSVLQAKSLR
jgi:hypothetical protein